jgi:phosphoglycerate dehydrogenase-like enzyme
VATIAIIDDWQNIARRYADWTQLEAVATLRFYRQPLGSEAQTAAELADCEIIVPLRERTQFTASLLAQLPHLRLLALTGRGLKHVDTAFCRDHGIVCSGANSYSPSAAGELTLGLMLAAARHIAAGDAAIRAGGFQSEIAPGHTLAGRTLGILGMGRIGTQVARYGRALDMQVIGWGRSFTDQRASAAGVERVTKEELLRHADVVSIHLTFTEETRDFIGAAELELLKPGALLVNTARGPIVNQTALLQALHAGRIHAALDVFDEEPLPADHPLRHAPNTVLTPHLGFNTHGTFEGFYRESVENIQGFMRRAPLRVLNPDSLPNVRWLGE